MKLLFVGLGGAGQRHLRIIKNYIQKDAEIYAYRIRGKQITLGENLEIIEGKSLDETYKINNVASLEQAFEIGMDAIFICNPTSHHKAIMKEAAKWKCPIFVEKPVVESANGLDEILEQIEANNLCTMVGYQNRFHPCICKTKSLLEENKIGDIVAINAEVCNDVRKWHTYEDYRSLYAVNNQLGGGVVLTQAHELDYIYLFLGMPSRVYAVGGQLTNLESDAEDVVSILLEYYLDGKRTPVHIYEDFIQNPPSRNCKIIGTRGKIVFDFITNNICVYDEDGNVSLQEQYELNNEQLFKEELEEFFNALSEKRDTCMPIKEGKASVVLAQAILESLKERIVVDIERENIFDK